MKKPWTRQSDRFEKNDCEQIQVHEETRNHLLWDPTVMNPDSKVQKAQWFEDARQSSKYKKSLRTARQDKEMDKLKSEFADLR